MSLLFLRPCGRWPVTSEHTLARTLDLPSLLSQGIESRDEEWHRALFQSLVESCVTVQLADPQIGPDGWPYLYVTCDGNSSEPMVRILDWLFDKGIGLVINGDKPEPDYVFTYGMIWNFKERGQFLTPMEQSVGVGKVNFEAGQKVLAGPPSSSYLPEYAKNILRQFLSAQGIRSPKILVMSRDTQHFDLCFSLESFGNPPGEEHQGIASAISWFLPSHYSLMLVSESGLPTFSDL